MIAPDARGRVLGTSLRTKPVKGSYAGCSSDDVPGSGKTNLKAPFDQKIKGYNEGRKATIKQLIEEAKRSSALLLGVNYMQRPWTI